MDNNNEHTFKSRVEFIRSIFEDKFAPADILASSIQHKLDVTLAQYIWETDMSYNILENKKALKILKKLDKED